MLSIQVVYPMLEKTGAIGKELADKSRDDHLKTKVALSEMDGKPMSAMQRQKIDAMMAERLEHIKVTGMDALASYNDALIMYSQLLVWVLS